MGGVQVFFVSQSGKTNVFDRRLKKHVFVLFEHKMQAKMGGVQVFFVSQSGKTNVLPD